MDMDWDVNLKNHDDMMSAGDDIISLYALNIKLKKWQVVPIQEIHW